MVYIYNHCMLATIQQKVAMTAWQKYHHFEQTRHTVHAKNKLSWVYSDSL